MPSTRGRPTQDPKIIRLDVRLTDSEAQMLDYAAEKLNAPKSEIIRRGIAYMHEKAKKEE